MYLNVTCQKFKNLNTHLRHITRLTRRVKCVRVYTYLTRVNTYNTIKFNKIQIKLEKYIRKIRVILIMKNTIDVPY
jgi:hypothetical protein